jgi:quercetin dioxygenase-like cupin family protein
MKKLIRLVVGILIPAFIMAGGGASSAVAQEKGKAAKAAPAAKAEKGKAVQKQLLENDKVRVFEVTFKPGDESASVARPNRVIRALKGGTLQVTSADGSKDVRQYKTGEVKYFEAEKQPSVLKNTGKSELVLYAVFLK